MRRPLTVINSYCQAVQVLCGNSLDEQCKEYVQEIYDGTLQMNRLIDTLLKFSSVMRDKIHHDPTDLSKMTEEVAGGLKLSDPKRRVTFRIDPELMAHGDTELLRVVLENLIGNAWKYTGNRQEAVIEFGVTKIDGMPAYFVRDYGSGFAMDHTGKLFIPFQRLPGSEEFRGHGIGLATLERIIKRHGGKVWADGELDKGATFYFRLSGNSQNE